MRAEMTAQRLGRRDTDWSRRRIACSIWLWAEITGGDPALAPLAAATSPTGRACTAGRMADVSEIHRSGRMTGFLASVRAWIASPGDARPAA